MNSEGVESIVGSDGLIDCVQGEVLIASACVTLPELDIANVTATLKRSTQPNDVTRRSGWIFAHLRTYTPSILQALEAPPELRVTLGYVARACPELLDEPEGEEQEEGKEGEDGEDGELGELGEEGEEAEKKARGSSADAPELCSLQPTAHGYGDDAPVEPNDEATDPLPVLHATHGMYLPAMTAMLLRETLSATIRISPSQVVLQYSEEEIAQEIERCEAEYNEAMALSSKDKKMQAAPAPFDKSSVPTEKRWLCLARAESGRRLSFKVQASPFGSLLASLSGRLRVHEAAGGTSEDVESSDPPQTMWHLGCSSPSESGELLLRGIFIPKEVPAGPAILIISEASTSLEQVVLPTFVEVELNVTIEVPMPEGLQPEPPKKMASAKPMKGRK
ncbi:MAG: hypothetical protein SGPRY_004850 [Prymnesium sp.]